MNWESIFSDKIKVATLLLILMTGIIISNIYEKRILENTQKSIRSIYEDRLQPATDLFEMKQLVENRIHILEQIIDKKRDSDELIDHELSALSQKFNSLLKQYEKTYLVPQEKEFIAVLKSDILKLDQLSKTLINREDNLSLDNLEKLKQLSDELSKDLSKLSKMQSEIGLEILDSYTKEKSINTVLNSIQIILSIIIGVIIFMQFSNRRIILAKIDKHNLN